MEQYSLELLTGVRTAKENISQGRISFDPANLYGDNEKGYSVRRRIEQAKRRVQDLKRDLHLAEERQDVEAREKQEDGNRIVIDDSDNESLMANNEEEVKDDHVSSTVVRGQKLNEQDRQDILDDLDYQNVRGFLLTLQHMDAAKYADFSNDNMYNDKNLPLPISPEQEPPSVLASLLDQISILSGVYLETVEPVRLPSIFQITWRINGRLRDSIQDAASSSLEKRTEFDIQLLVDERARRMSSMEISVPDDIWMEIEPQLYFCQNTNCFNSFCSYYSQYGELFFARERLFSAMIKKYPGQVKTVFGAEFLPTEVTSHTLEMKSIDGHGAWLVWGPYFEHQNLSQSTTGKDNGVTNNREGYSMRTRLELWCYRKGSNQCELDHQFQILARSKGLQKALDIFLEAFLVKDIR